VRSNFAETSKQSLGAKFGNSKPSASDFGLESLVFDESLCKTLRHPVFYFILQTLQNLPEMIGTFYGRSASFVVG